MPQHYDDIIHLPHHVSAAHPRMAMSDRAAQCSPFAALAGFGAVKKIDDYERRVLMSDGTRIPLAEITAIEVLDGEDDDA